MIGPGEGENAQEVQLEVEVCVVGSSRQCPDGILKVIFTRVVTTFHIGADDFKLGKYVVLRKESALGRFGKVPDVTLELEPGGDAVKNVEGRTRLVRHGLETIVGDLSRNVDFGCYAILVSKSCHAAWV